MRLRLLSALALGAALLAGPAAAQEKFPNRPVRIVTAFAPGTATDIIARILAEQMRHSLGQAVVVENKPGAFGIVAIEEMARSRPDGHTVMIGNVTTSALTPILHRSKFSIDYDKEVTPIARVAELPNFLVVTTKGLSVNTLAELIDYAKKNPGKLRYSSTGVGSFVHYDMEILARKAGIKMDHIPHKEGPTATLKDMLNGDVHLSWMNVATAGPHVRSGAIKALAVVGDKRLQDYPDVPSMAEAGYPGVGSTLWSMMFAPAATPEPIQQQLHAAVNAALASDQVKEQYRKQQISPTPTASVAETRKWLAEQMDNWRRVTQEVKVDAE